MEVNKDEALRCCDIARRLLAEGNLERATKFIQKSIKLCPTEEGRILARQVQRLSEEASKHDAAEGTSANASSSSSSTSTPKHSHAQTNGHANGHSSASAGSSHKAPSSTTKSASSSTSSTPRSTSTEPETKPYTPEQVQRVKEILKKKCLYERLSVTRDASKGIIKKAYHKLALEFHPDKNSAPGASEAFKAISKAFDILNDDQKRRQYDVTGEDEPPTPQARHPGQFHGEMTPEEMFARFFGGADFVFQQPRRRNPYQQHYQQQQQRHAEPQSESFQLLQIFFALILILLMTTSFLQPAREPLYSLKATGAYRVPQTLKDLDMVKFWVKDSFPVDTRDPSVLSEVLRDVEQNFLANVVQGCARARYNEQNVDCRLLAAYREAKEKLRERRGRG